MTLMPQTQSDGPADIVVVFDDQDPWHCGSVSKPSEVTVLSGAPSDRRYTTITRAGERGVRYLSVMSPAHRDHLGSPD